MKQQQWLLSRNIKIGNKIYKRGMYPVQIGRKTMCAFCGGTIDKTKQRKPKARKET